MLQIQTPVYYQVKEKQTVRQIAAAFGVSPYLLARENGLTAEPPTGSVLRIPNRRGNVYTVKAGESKTLLCGSKERYYLQNGTDVLYIGMQVIL